ncbi:MAG: hypothetical protein JWQ76_1151, partial [Ramlibacter sp.]|nr:hypothetical protein [Ramlibacter sp.]
VDALSAVLSPSATGGAMALPCGELPSPTRQYVTQCDLATLVVEVATDSDSAAKPYLLSLPGPGPMLQREDAIDVVCGVRPFMDSGAGQGFDVKAGKIERKPAKVKVTASYAAQCGLPGHPGIRVEPEGGDVRICKAQVVDGTTVSFEAFRLPNAVESSMALVNGGAVGTVARMLWELIHNDSAAGSVTVRTDSCGLRLAGAPVGGLAARIRLYSEDEVSVTLKLPAFLGRGKSKEAKTGSSSGEMQVSTEKDAHGRMAFEKEEDESGSSRQVKERTQLGRFAAERTTSATKSNGKLSASRKTELSLAAGFDLTLTWNGQSVGREAVKDFLETVELLSQAVERFQALWAAGPGVKVAVGWSASWNLSFLQIDASYKGFRKVGSGGAQLHKHREVNGTVTAVTGSATAGFGLLVEVQRLNVDLLVLDYRVTLTLEGTVKGGLKWSNDVKDGKEETQSPWSQPVSGEAKLTLEARGTAAVCGRTIGCILSVASGLEVEGELAIAAWMVEKIEIKLKPVVFTVKVMVGSTGEPDLVQTHELWKGMPLLDYPAKAAT